MDGAGVEVESQASSEEYTDEKVVDSFPAGLGTEDWPRHVKWCWTIAGGILIVLVLLLPLCATPCIDINAASTAKTTMDKRAAQVTNSATDSSSALENFDSSAADNSIEANTAEQEWVGTTAQNEAAPEASHKTILIYWHRITGSEGLRASGFPYVDSHYLSEEVGITAEIFDDATKAGASLEHWLNYSIVGSVVALCCAIFIIWCFDKAHTWLQKVSDRNRPHEYSNTGRFRDGVHNCCSNTAKRCHIACAGIVYIILLAPLFCIVGAVVAICGYMFVVRPGLDDVVKYLNTDIAGGTVQETTVTVARSNAWWVPILFCTISGIGTTFIGVRALWHAWKQCCNKRRNR